LATFAPLRFQVPAVVFLVSKQCGDACHVRQITEFPVAVDRVRVQTAIETGTFPLEAG